MIIHKRTINWNSPSVGRPMSVRIIGDYGTPLLIFNNAGDDAMTWEDKGMVSGVRFQLEHGFNQLFCLDSIDKEIITDTRIDAFTRLVRLHYFEEYIMDEVIPFVRKENPIRYLIAAGIGTGAYHSINLALKHPGLFDKVIAISGIYDIRQYYGDKKEEKRYYNNPVEYLPNLTDQEFLEGANRIDFRLLSSEDDPRCEESRMLSDLFNLKSIPHALDIWKSGKLTGWPVWAKMIAKHIV